MVCRENEKSKIMVLRMKNLIGLLSVRRINRVPDHSLLDDQTLWLEISVG